MFNNNVILFIILFVLSVVFSDTFFAEFLIFVFAILQFSDFMSHPQLIVTTYDYFLGGYLFLLNALYAMICMLQWVSDSKKRREEEGGVA